MNNLTECLGADIVVMELDTEKIEQFKNYRLGTGRTSKEGINNDLKNIKAMLNDAVKHGLIHKNPVPRMPRFKTEKRLPKYYTQEEIIALKQKKFKGEMWLAFILFIYTGARRCEIVRKRLNDNNRGLKWKHIDWMRDQIRLYSKGQEGIVPLHPTLRKMILDRKAELGGSFDPEDHVIHFIRDTLTTYFSRAKKKAGIDKEGAVHILRHTAGTNVQKAKGNIRVTQEFLRHKNIATTKIYTHIVNEEVDEAVKNAFS